jgi:regulator of sigma E protease
MVVLVKIAQFLLSISILVLVHELGHFLFARLFKARVEKFRIFFDYKFTIWKKKIGETDFGFGWIPLGGYVKIAGMIDESMDRDQMKKPPQPWEFRSKPAWQRLLIMIGGVLFNLLFAWFIYSATLNVWGDQYLPNENVVNGLVCSDVAKEVGFQTGDKVLSIYGESVERYSEINARILMDGPGEVLVMRDGKQESVYVRSDEVGAIISGGGMLFDSPRIPFVVAQTAPGSGAELAGLMAGDRLMAVNGDTLRFFDQYSSHLKAFAGRKVSVALMRENALVEKIVLLDSLGKLGVYAVSPYSLLETESYTYSLVESIPQGFVRAKSTVVSYLKQLKLLASPEVKASESLGGFISIGRIFPGVWNWEMFWNLTAFLSILLAVMNILPIPALDGGHVIILLVEMITRRKPSQRILEMLQMVGIVFILALVIFANVNDVIGLFSK